MADEEFRTAITAFLRTWIGEEFFARGQSEEDFEDMVNQLVNQGSPVTQMLRSFHASLPHDQYDGGNFPGQGQTRHFRPHALSQQCRIELREGAGLARSVSTQGKAGKSDTALYSCSLLQVRVRCGMP